MKMLSEQNGQDEMRDQQRLSTVSYRHCCFRYSYVPACESLRALGVAILDHVYSLVAFDEESLPMLLITCLKRGLIQLCEPRCPTKKRWVRYRLEHTVIYKLAKRDMPVNTIYYLRIPEIRGCAGRLILRECCC